MGLTWFTKLNHAAIRLPEGSGPQGHRHLASVIRGKKKYKYCNSPLFSTCQEGAVTPSIRSGEGWDPEDLGLGGEDLLVL